MKSGNCIYATGTHENARRERTTPTCANNGVELRSNACMRESAQPCFSAFHQQNVRKKRA